MKRAVFLLAVCLTSFILQPLVSYAAGPVFGQVAGVGSSQFSVDGHNWTATGRSFPIGAEAWYRTGDGRLAFILNDGTRIELGDDSAMTLRCSSGSYAVALEKGKIGVSVNGNSSVIVTTPDALKMVVSEKDSIAGAYFDWKKTQVVSLLGNLKVVDGATVMSLASGKSYIKENGQQRVVPVAEGGTQDSDLEGAKKKGSLLELLIPAGIVIGGAATGMLLSDDDDDDEEVASPAVP